jgi:predicted RNase H-like nuclease (RuvC/YqgF family)
MKCECKENESPPLSYIEESEKQITTLRAEVERLTRNVTMLGKWRDLAEEDNESLRSQLSDRDAEVRALRELIEGSGEWSPNSRGKMIFRFGGGFIADDATLALITGEPGPGGEG